MKILITGSEGFVGSYLYRRLSQNHEVIGYDLKDGENIFNSRLLNRKLKGVDVVIHLAAFVDGNESWEKPYEYLMNNGIGTFKVIKSSIENGVKRIIVFSSAAIYGKPLTPYGASKVFAEAIADSYKDQIETVVLRPFNIYGKGQNPAYGYAIHNFHKGINDKGVVRIYGDGNQTRDFIFIDDIVNVVEFMLTAKLPTKPIDVGTGRGVKILDLVKLIGKLVGKDYSIKFADPRREIKRSKADTTGLKQIGIDVASFQTLGEGLKSTLS